MSRRHQDPRLAAAAPDSAVFLACAEACLARLPPALRAAAEGMVIIVEDYAAEALLDELGIEDPLSLSGLYTGLDVTQESLIDPALEAPLIHLFRLPIMLEWAERGDVTLAELIDHVMIHELGHHFGWSDEDMHAALDAAS